MYTDLLGTGKSKSAFSRYFSGGSSQRAEGFHKILGAANVKPLKPVMDSLRVNKSDAEIVNMAKAGRISGRVFTEAMKTGFSTEKELWSFLDFGFKMHGLDGPAYVPVVAGGQVGMVASTKRDRSLTVHRMA